MKLLLLPTLTTISGLLHPVPIHARPHPQAQQTSPTTTTRWQISLYQNQQCTGETTSFSGNGSVICHDTILNGGALGYIVTMGAWSNCSVRVFDDTACRRLIDVVDGENNGSCQVPDVQEEEIRGVEVSC
ncbi:hypothetical protein BO94DRAFT_9135 [Aspergillus sclerotioniger CBS 115572]|uniref:Uncharacterized protein n=1 Tax=Aspergillus sclerotioniger CBS 115572 TaxID=1450535 RepID=A0A317XCS0_9EURO|nr:hypothetical protein BO94DRAFT_9135 [Aspergillus sclerotioniger CBS 115572]PWY96416.1 hypothetical protein BO94DRAFT_9135 [Aspergillus sclerotioniger CBS 115572]